MNRWTGYRAGAVVLVVLGLVVLVAAGPVRGPTAVKAQACSWTGRWMLGNGSTATFTQAGTDLTGDDGNGDNITGTVSGNHLTGRWVHGSDGGPIDLTMDSSCNSFTGTFGYDSGRTPDPFNGARVGGGQPTPMPPAGSPPATDLTGLWVDNSDGGAIYRLRQIDDRLYWSVDATAVGSFANVFVGTIDGATIQGTWVDLPGSPMLGGGSLTLRVESKDHLVKVEETSFYPPREWFRQSGD